MKWPLLVMTPKQRTTEDGAEARLHRAVDRLDTLTKRLESVVAEVQEGDLGARRQRGEGV